MQGRYGFDEFGKFLLITSMIVILLSNFVRIRFLYLAGLLLLVYAYYRIVSRNIFKRKRENQTYLNFKSKFTGKNRNAMKNWDRQKGTGYSGGAGSGQNQNQQYNYYRCRNCGQTIRVPKGKGTLKITCPKCGNSFIQPS